MRAGLGPARPRAQIESEIRECVGGRNVFFFVSGGVDSTVAFALCPRALGAERVRGVYVDTGLMREGETDFVRRMRRRRPWKRPQTQFLGALAGVTDPERKRHIIGEEFVRVQERIIEARQACWTNTGFWARAPSIPTPSNRAARPRRRSSRRTTTAWPAFRS